MPKQTKIWWHIKTQTTSSFIFSNTFTSTVNPLALFLEGRVPRVPCLVSDTIWHVAPIHPHSHTWITCFSILTKIPNFCFSSFYYTKIIGKLLSAIWQILGKYWHIEINIKKITVFITNIIISFTILVYSVLNTGWITYFSPHSPGTSPRSTFPFQTLREEW